MTFNSFPIQTIEVDLPAIQRSIRDSMERAEDAARDAAQSASEVYSGEVRDAKEAAIAAADTAAESMTKAREWAESDFAPDASDSSSKSAKTWANMIRTMYENIEGFQDEAGELVEELRQAVDFRVYRVRVVADTNTYALDADGQPLQLSSSGTIAMGPAPYGMLIPGVDYEVLADGRFRILASIAVDTILNITSLGRVSNEEAQELVEAVRGEFREVVEKLEEALTIKQQTVIATVGQTVIVNDYMTDPVIALGGVALVSKHGVGLLTQGLDFTVNSSSQVVMNVPLSAGDRIDIITFPRVPTGEAQALIQELDSKVQQAKEAAIEAKEGIIVKQQYLTATAGQSTLTSDRYGELIRVVAGSAIVSIHGVGILTVGVDYTIDADGIIHLTRPLAGGELVQTVTIPRVPFTQSQGFVTQAIEARDRAEAAANFVRNAHVMQQQVIYTTAGQTVLNTDVDGDLIRIQSGRAMIVLQGVGQLTPHVDYTVSEIGVITLVRPVEAGNIIIVTSFPTISASDLQGDVAAVTGQIEALKDYVNAKEQEIDDHVQSAVDLLNGALVEDQLLLTVVDGQTVYMEDDEGTELNLASKAVIVSLDRGGILRVGVDFDVTPDGGIELLQSFAPGSKLLLQRRMIKPTSDAEAILSVFEDRVRDEADRAEAAVDRADIFGPRTVQNARYFFTVDADVGVWGTQSGEASWKVKALGETPIDFIHPVSGLGVEVLPMLDGVSITACGAVGDMNVTTFAGTDNTEAIRLAFTVGMRMYRVAGGTSNFLARKIPIYVPSGVYKVTGDLFADVVAVTGGRLSFHLKGVGKGVGYGGGSGGSCLYYTGTDTAMFENAAKAAWCSFTGIQFSADASAARRLWNGPTGNGIQAFEFWDCGFWGFSDFFYIGGATNNSEYTFNSCKFSNFSGKAFNFDNEQGLNFRFFGCDFEVFSGTMFSFRQGTNVALYGGSIIPTTGSARIFEVPSDAVNTTFGHNNSPNLLVSGVRFEVRGAAHLLRKESHAPNFIAIFEGCGLGGYNVSGGGKSIYWRGNGNLTFRNCRGLEGHLVDYSIAGSAAQKLYLNLENTTPPSTFFAQSSWEVTGFTQGTGRLPLVNLSGNAPGNNGVFIPESSNQSGAVQMWREHVFTQEGNAILVSNWDGATPLERTLALPPVRVRGCVINPIRTTTYGTATATIVVKTKTGTILGTATWTMNATDLPPIQLNFAHKLTTAADNDSLVFEFSTSRSTAATPFHWAGSMALLY